MAITSAQPTANRTQAQELGGEASAPSGDWAEAFDWYAFVCSGCGEETFVGRDFEQSMDDFALMCDWLHGYPPTCSTCQQAA